MHQSLSFLATQSIQHQVSLDMLAQKQRYEFRQLEIIQSMPSIEGIPKHQNSLQHCRTMTRRRRLRLPSTLSSKDMQTLRAWLMSDSSSLLIAEAHGAKTSSRDFAVHLLDEVLKVQVPAIWALSNSSDTENVPSIEEFLASLVMQVIKLNLSVLSESSNPISVGHIKAAENVDQWLRLLQKSICGLRSLLVVLDFITIRGCLNTEEGLDAEEFLERFLDIADSTKASVKIIALTWRMDHILQENSHNLVDAQRIFTDPGARKMRLMRNPKYRAAYIARRQKVALALREGVWTDASNSNKDDE
jgi:hypothetical protein